jgi:hypothetical protein
MLLGPTLAAISLTLTDSSTATVRPALTDDGLTMDVRTAPASTLSFTRGRSALSLSYSPSFAWLNVTRDPELVVLHTASIDYSWSMPRLSLTLGLSGTLGSQSFLTVGLATESTPPVDANVPAPAGMPPVTPTDTAFRPQQEIVRTGSLRASLDGTYVLSRRWTASAGVAYIVSGGLGESSDVLPLRKGPQGRFALAYALTRRDTLTTSANGSVDTVRERGSRFITVGALESWSHRFAPLTQGSVGLGVTYLRSRASARASHENSVLGAGDLAFSQGWLLEARARLTFTANAGLGTAYNQVLGVVTQQARANAGLGWAKDRTSLGVVFQVAQTLPLDAPDAALGYGGSANVGYDVADPIQLRAGGSWSRQKLPNAVTAPGFRNDQWQAFIGVNLAAPVMTF